MNGIDFANSLARVRERMEIAAARSKRPVEAISLLPVTKVFPAEAIRVAYEHGLRDFGENYVQEFEGKQPGISDLAEARFHLIGHLQSNKSRKAAELFQVIQTVDSAKLARRLNDLAVHLEVMIEVKLSLEDSKWGVSETRLSEVVDAVKDCRHLTLTGLMTVPAWSSDPEQSRPSFARLSELGEIYGLPKLSMGMSSDLEVAIEEGSTLVRVGTALFGSRKKA